MIYIFVIKTKISHYIHICVLKFTTQKIQRVRVLLKLISDFST